MIDEVPPQLKKLVRLVVRAFYQPEHYILMDILARYPCVNETDLTSLLKVDFKKLRVILSSLKKDKLVKSIQKMESKELENGETKNYLSHYHYINYKVFVNVVKFKLNKMRERIQAEERRVCNKSSYICTNCEKTYTDLDIDRLIDPLEGTLKCIMCGTVLIEETPEVETIDARSVLSKLNDQLKPILDLLKEVENISLAPDVLDPEPKSIEGLINNSKHERSKQQQSKAGWSMNKGYDIYGDQTISINIGDDDKLKKKVTTYFHLSIFNLPECQCVSNCCMIDDTMIYQWKDCLHGLI
jgi:transcription initiation factor TFIIE subunit alpha